MIQCIILFLSILISITVSFIIYRKGTLKYLKKVEKKVPKKTRQTCEIFIYVNNKPYKESINCMGINIDSNCTIFVKSDIEQLGLVIDQMQMEERIKEKKMVR